MDILKFNRIVAFCESSNSGLRTIKWSKDVLRKLWLACLKGRGVVLVFHVREEWSSCPQNTIVSDIWT